MEGGIVADRYEAIKRIGHGSYGSVYLARRRGTTSSVVVLKRVFVVEEGSKEHREAINEVKLLQRLRHRNIVAYKDSFIRDSHLCIVMSFCSGGDLHSQIRAARASCRSFTLEQVLEWLAQILEALRYLHEEKRILHRDLKSQNVFIVPERQVVVSDWKEEGGEEAAGSEGEVKFVPSVRKDELFLVTHKAREGWSFGFSERANGKSNLEGKGYVPQACLKRLPPGSHRTSVKLGDFGISKSLSSTEDMASTVIGTPYYMSPELCQNEPYNHKSDLWAVGCLLYEVVMLRHAFEAKNLNELVLNIMQGKVMVYLPLPLLTSWQYPPVDKEKWGEDIPKLVD
eukprot:756211-Hanusia_phi.AAC.1